MLFLLFKVKSCKNILFFNLRLRIENKKLVKVIQGRVMNLDLPVFRIENL